MEVVADDPRDSSLAETDQDRDPVNRDAHTNPDSREQTEMHLTSEVLRPLEKEPEPVPFNALVDVDSHLPSASSSGLEITANENNTLRIDGSTSLGEHSESSPVPNDLHQNLDVPERVIVHEQREHSDEPCSPKTSQVQTATESPCDLSSLPEELPHSVEPATDSLQEVARSSYPDENVDQRLETGLHLSEDVEMKSIQPAPWPDTCQSCYCSRSPVDSSSFHRIASTFLRGTLCQAVVQKGAQMQSCLHTLSQDDYAVRFEIGADKVVALCHFHQEELRLHHLCPVCATFYDSGLMTLCRGNGTDFHFFHRTCLKAENWSFAHCPHCGNSVDSCEEINGFPLELRFPQPSKIPPLSVLTFTDRVSPMPAVPPRTICRFNDKLVFTPKGLWRDTDLRRMADLMAKLSNLTSREFMQKRDDETLLKAVEDDDPLTLAFCLLDVGPWTPTNSKMSMLPQAVDLACSTGHLVCLHLLHVADVPLDTVDEKGFSPLMRAVMEGQFDIARYLYKECHCDLDQTDSEGKTVLHHLLDSSSDHHLIFRLVDYGLITPFLIKILTEDSQDLFVPVYLRVHAERLLPEPKDHFARFQKAIMNHDEDTAATIIMFHFPEILKRPLKDLKDLCESWPSIWALVEQKWIASEKNYVVCHDITNGKERSPIRLIGRPEDSSLENDFTYVSRNVYPSSIKPLLARNSLISCDCGPVCHPGGCRCRQMSSRYYSDGRLGPKHQDDTRNVVYECHEFCQCGPECGNRVIQKGIRAPLEVRKTPNRGWGLFARSFISEGEFLAEYCGEVVTDQEVNTREHAGVYLFELRDCEINGQKDGKNKETYCVDADKIGNVARFINHSCSPTAHPIWFFHQIQDSRFPRIGFFAAKDIHAGEEICFDYGKSFWTMKNYEFKCECGSYECRYRPQPPATVGLGSHSKTASGTTPAATSHGSGKKTMGSDTNGQEASKRRKM
ncbi:histone-lysine N-methyltransferase EHMT1-like [Paramacrobiotus metropolitanus]|uniref:histone-lysine N-methyltransferase EHMT1-like n=1 Tax=Paramacrobiotus metropolitanus TaxID=2943436 RepID=UPI002445DA2B|nr:histone-lysine N-methyltransferase EHMT1-like [Paramacrobiotus metropolitanus]